MRSGQAELIILLGVVILVAIVLLFTFRPDLPTPVPNSIGQEQKAVRDAIVQTATTTGGDTLKLLSSHGGYLAPTDGVQFLGSRVAYWQQCENSNPPTLATVEQEFERGLTDALRARLLTLRPANTEMDMSKLSVDAVIQDDRIDVRLTLPTKVSGYAISQPFQFSIPTRLKKIVAFGRDFSQEAAASRLLEYHTLAALYFSPLAADGEPEVPTSGFLQSCGQTLFRSTDQLADGMKHVLTYTLASTLWWVPRPVTATGVQVFSIPSVNGKTYPDLDIDFYVPDEFRFRFSSPIMIQDSEFDYSLGGPFSVPNCNLPYFQKYNVVYPVITSVQDTLNGNRFSFSSLASFGDAGSEKSMEPSSCGTVGGTPSGIDCSNRLCSTSLTIQDERSRSLAGAQVFSNGCYIGETAATGTLAGAIPCGDNNISIYLSEEYDYVLNATTSDSLASATYVLGKKMPVTVFFKEMKSGTCSSPVDHESIALLFTNRLTGHTYPFTNTEDATAPSCDPANPFSCAPTGGTISSEASGEMPSGDYEMQVFLTNPTVQAAHSGTTLVPFVIVENITIPTRSAVNLTLNLMDTDQLFTDAANCIGDDGSAARGQCAPAFTSCSGFDCSTLVSKETRLYYLINYFYRGTGRNALDTQLAVCGKTLVEVV